jgi:hypothetical protein
MRGRTFGCLVVLALMAGVIWTSAPPALAQMAWSIGNPNDDGSFTTSAGTLTLTNIDTGATTSCSASSLYGRIPTAAGVQEIGTLDFGEATGCAGPGGSSPSVDLFGPMLLYGESYDAARGRATIETVPLGDPLYVTEPGCDYVASGSFTMSYTNSTSQLVIDGATFTVTEATGPACNGVAQIGDTLELSAAHTVTPAITMVATAPRFTVTGSTGAGGAYTTTQSATTTHVLGDITTANHSPCSAATVTGRIPNGSGLPGAGIGAVTSASLGRCSLFPYTDGVFTITPVNLPWRLDALTYVSTDGGAVAGSIANFELSVTGPGCSFSVTATPTPTDWQYGEFNDTPDVLLISPDGAEISNVSGCGGSFNDGDQAWYSNGYDVSPTTLQIIGT